MKLLLDEHINPAVARGLLRVRPDLEVLEVRQLLRGMPDPELLEWATQNGCILVTADRQTLVGFYYERLKAALPSQGVFVVRPDATPGAIVEELLLILETSNTEEWANQVNYVPL